MYNQNYSWQSQKLVSRASMASTLEKSLREGFMNKDSSIFNNPEFLSQLPTPETLMAYAFVNGDVNLLLTLIKYDTSGAWSKMMSQMAEIVQQRLDELEFEKVQDKISVMRLDEVHV